MAFSGLAALLAGGLQHPGYTLLKYFYVARLTEDGGFILNCKPNQTKPKKWGTVVRLAGLILQYVSNR